MKCFTNVRFILTTMLTIAFMTFGCGNELPGIDTLNEADSTDRDIMLEPDQATYDTGANRIDAVSGDVLLPPDQGQNDASSGSDNAIGSDESITTDSTLQDTTGDDDLTQISDNGNDTEPDVIVDSGVEQDTWIEPVPFECSSGLVKAGWNQKWSVAGKSRDFLAVFPENPNSRPLGVIFVFHGYGDNVDSFRKFFQPDPDNDPEFPFILIYPKSMALQPMGTTPKGIEWTLLTSEPGDSNQDALFFEEILGCLGTTVTVDMGSVFSFGFSAGAIFTNMLHSRYPDIFKAVVSMSGAWFNDSATVKAVNTMGMATLSWNDLETGDGTVFMTHGGNTDTFDTMGITIVDFEKSAGFAVPFLKGAGRTVIDCPHNDGHTNHRDISTADVMKFFKDHRDGKSPYAATGIPSAFSPSCQIK